MQNKKVISAVVIVVVAIVLLVVFKKQSASSNADADATAFCESIQNGKTVDEVMQSVGASSFEHLTFSGPGGEVINGANKGTFSPSKSAGFTSGKMLVQFHPNVTIIKACEIDFEQGQVTGKTVKL
ncbi:hypothetical protein [Bdellovibrio sp. HCB209]|uniref:hypothetical protein n=1 Tax=Bdellovibrio sp. HCB209 TaxID=3394354 RepID=UPI0039B451B2